MRALPRDGADTARPQVVAGPPGARRPRPEEGGPGQCGRRVRTRLNRGSGRLVNLEAYALPSESAPTLLQRSSWHSKPQRSLGIVMVRLLSLRSGPGVRAMTLNFLGGED